MGFLRNTGPRGTTDMFYINRITVFGFALLAAICLFVGWNLAQQTEILDWVDHTYGVQQQTQKVLALVIDAEDGQRGYLFIQTPLTLKRFNQARADLPDSIRKLRQLTSDNSRQQARLNRLSVVIGDRMRQLADFIEIYRAQGESAARAAALSGTGKETMAEIRSILGAFDREESLLLKERIQRRNLNLRNEVVGLSGSLALGLAYLLFGGLQQARLKAEERKSEQSRRELKIMREFVERAPMGILMLDRRLRPVQVSQRWLDDFGLTREEFLAPSASPRDPSGPFLLWSWRELYPLALAGETFSGTDEHYSTPDNVEHWFDWRMVPWGDSGETSGGIIIYSEDITKRKQAEATARRHELQYRALFENMPDAAAYCQLIGPPENEGNFVVLAANPAFSSLVNLEQPVGSTAATLFPDLDPSLHHLYARVAETGRSETVDFYHEKSGRWFHEIAYSPEPGFFVLMVEDITHRKKEEAIARLWHNAFEESRSGIALEDVATGTIEAANPAYARSLGYTTGELAGQSVSLIYPEGELAHRKRVLEAEESAGGHVLFETLHIKKGGSQIPVLVDMTVIRDADGKPVSHIKIVHDLTETRRTSEALRSSEARAESLFENASQGILTVDAAGRIMTENAMVQQLFGYSRGELIGQSVEMLLSRNFRDRKIGNLLTRWHSRSVEQGINLIARRKDESEFPIEVSLSQVRENGGELTMAFISDITERVRADAALRESEEQFRTLANAIPNLCWMANADGTPLWFNRRWFDYTGTTMAQLENGGWTTVHEPGALPEILECWSHSIATGEHFEMTLALRSANGLYRDFLTRAIPISNADGHITRWFGTNTDISKQRETEQSLRLQAKQLEEANGELMRASEALRTSEARARSLMENASQAILTADMGGRILDGSLMVQRLFGYDNGELIGSPLVRLLPTQDEERSTLLHDAPGQCRRLRAVRKNGTEFPAEISVSYIGESSNRISLTFVSDITSRNKADEEREDLILRLRDALSEKTVLLQEVHHRVKNNLSIIAALLRMQSSGMEEGRAKMAMEESQQRVQSMSRIHEFLYATKNLDRIDFGKYIEHLTAELFDSYSLSNSVSVKVHAEKIDLPVDHAIPCGLILNELLTNTFKYAFPDGRAGEVLVRFHRLEEDKLSLSCSDNGVGIPESFQWENSKSLGLRIIRTLTKQINGQLQLDRTRGTKFEVQFTQPATAPREKSHRQAK